jgi:hypothetical protein
MATTRAISWSAPTTQIWYRKSYLTYNFEFPIREFQAGFRSLELSQYSEICSLIAANNSLFVDLGNCRLND